MLFIVCAGAVALSMQAGQGTWSQRGPDAVADLDLLSIRQVAAEVDVAFADLHRQRSVTATDRADDLMIARRISLALTGSIPSLAEIRELESQPDSARLDQLLCRLLNEPRCHDYLAERLARTLVGVADGPFLIYRRHRFVDWLAGQIRENAGWDEVVTTMLTADGVWTDSPAVNFYTRTIVPDAEDRPNPDPVLLASRVSRGLLGMRIDCIACHDDFLGNVSLGDVDDPRAGTQTDFHALAAFFAETQNSILGIRDQSAGERSYRTRLVGDDDKTEIEPAVPFHESLLPASGVLRDDLAAWITHRDNRPFARGIVNRIWALLLTEPLIEPVDDIPLCGPFPIALECLVDDFVEQGCDLRRLIRVIASTRAFQCQSRTPLTADLESDSGAFDSFPFRRLRSEQIAGSIIAASSLKASDETTRALGRLRNAIETGEFIERFGDAGEDEMDEPAETVPRQLLMLNGKLVNERIKDDVFAPAHIASLSPDAETAIETAFLCTLSRRPTESERAWFSIQISFDKRNSATRQIQDLYWSLLNSAEFATSH